MELYVTAEDINISLTNNRRNRVALTEVDKYEVLSHFEVSEVVEHFGVEKLLDHIGPDEAFIHSYKEK